MIEKEKLVKIGCYAGIGLAVVFVSLVLIAALNYPGYTVSGNYLSDLGVGEKSAVFFNSAVIISGLLGLLFGAGAFIIFEKPLGRIGAVMFIVAHIALIGVGIFTEASGGLHDMAAMLYFLLTAVAWLVIGMEVRAETKIGYFSLFVGGLILISIATGLPPLLEHISAVVIGINGILVAVHLLGKI